MSATITAVLWSLVQVGLLALISVGIPLLAKYVLAQVGLINTKAAGTKWGDVLFQLEKVCVSGVQAAEQVLGSSNANNVAKKAMVLHLVQAWLNARGVVVDVTVIEAAIEAAVFEQFTRPALKVATSAPTVLVVPVTAPDKAA